MTLQQLTYFKIVAKGKNITKAAEEIYISPSALSKSIRALEFELGFSLFEKSGRSLRLSQYGKVFYDYAVQAIDALNMGQQLVQDKMDTASGHLDIIGNWKVCTKHLPVLIKAFHCTHPEVTFSIQHATTKQVLGKVISGEVDCGFCGDFDLDAHNGELQRHLIRRDEVVFIVPKDHSQANNQYVDTTSLGHEKWIAILDMRDKTHPQIETFWEEYGIAPKIVCEVPNEASIINLVEMGVGVSLSVDDPSLHTGKLAVLRLKDPPVKSCYLVWKTGREETAVMKAFRACIASNSVPVEV